MDWLKKKKEEAKQAASQAAAKMQNRRSAFKGEGNVLGGGGSVGDGNGSSGSGGASDAAAASTQAAASPAPPRSFKVPSFGKSTNEPPPLSEDERREQREARLKALEERTGAWDKRVANARKARLQQEAELESKFALPPVPVSEPSSGSAPSGSSGSSGSTASGPTAMSGAVSGAAPRVLSAEEMRAFELQNAQASVGFNPYAVVMSSSTEASTAMHSISSGPQSSAMPPPPPSSASRPSAVAAATARAPAIASPAAAVPHVPSDTYSDAALLPPAMTETESTSSQDGAGGVFVLLRQEPARAIAAAETIIKVLSNILQHPQEDKFRKIRVANPSIQTKLVAVRGAVELLAEAGFAPLDVDGEQCLVLAAHALDTARVQAVRDRTEVALIQLQVDSAAL